MMKKSIVAVALVFATLFSFTACRKISGDSSFLIETKSYVVDSDGVTREVETRVNTDTGETEYYYTDVVGNAVTVAHNDVRTETTRVEQTKKAGSKSNPGTNENTIGTLPGGETVPAEVEQIFSEMANGEVSMEKLAEKTAQEDTVMEISEEIIPDSQIKEVDVPVDSSGKPQRKTLLDSYGKIMEGDTFTFKFKMQAELPTDAGTTQMVTIPMTMMKSGNKMYLETRYPVSANSSVPVAALVGDNAAYLMIPSMRGYISMPAEDLSGMLNMDNMHEEMLDASESKKYVSSGEVTIDGVTYSVDIYQDGDVEERYFFLNDELKRMERLEDGSTNIIEITEMTATVDSSKFVVPKGYIDYSSVLGGENVNLGTIVQ